MENKMTNNNYLKNSILGKEVKKDTPVKEWLVEHVGTIFQTEMDKANEENLENPLDWDGSVTVEMLIEVMASEFPDFLLAVAEENFIRGYEQAMVDVYGNNETQEE